MCSTSPAETEFAWVEELTFYLIVLWSYTLQINSNDSYAWSPLNRFVNKSRHDRLVGELEKWERRREKKQESEEEEGGEKWGEREREREREQKMLGEKKKEKKKVRQCHLLVIARPLVKHEDRWRFPAKVITIFFSISFFLIPSLILSFFISLSLSLSLSLILFLSYSPCVYPSASFLGLLRVLC